MQVIRDRWRALLCGVLSLLFFAGSSCSQQEWSWLHQTKLSEQDYAKGAAQGALEIASESVTPFNQLLCSWNALRPSAGYFSFFVSVRDSATQEWGKWHHIADWGATTQRSYESRGSGDERYLYVRLERGDQHADGFRVKVTGTSDVSLRDVKSLAVSVSDFKKFSPEDGKTFASLPSVALKGVPKISQLALDHPKNTDICSPVACTTLINFLTSAGHNPFDVTECVFDSGLNVYGSWPFNVAHLFALGQGAYWTYVRRLNSFEQLHQQLMRGIPSVVSVRGELTGAAKVYGGGHLMVVVGWDPITHEVICHDSAFSTHADTVKRYAIDEFLRAWERSHRLTYWAEPAENKGEYA